MAELTDPGSNVCDGLSDFHWIWHISHHMQPHITPHSHTQGHGDVCCCVPFALWVYGIVLRSFILCLLAGFATSSV